MYTRETETATARRAKSGARRGASDASTIAPAALIEA